MPCHKKLDVKTSFCRLAYREETVMRSLCSSVLSVVNPPAIPARMHKKTTEDTGQHREKTGM